MPVTVCIGGRLIVKITGLATELPCLAASGTAAGGTRTVRRTITSERMLALLARQFPGQVSDSRYRVFAYSGKWHAT